MEDALRSRIAATGLVISRQADDLGVDHHRLARLLRDGGLVRVRAGVDVDGERHRVAEPATRHLTELRAVLADGRSESPGETWARLLFHEVGLRGLEPQVELRAADGRVIARVDFLDRVHGLVVEFDGASTYAGGGTGQAALVAEKRREDAIRRLGYRCCGSSGPISSTPRASTGSCARPVWMATYTRVVSPQGGDKPGDNSS